jgi:hypothetical protein
MQIAAEYQNFSSADEKNGERLNSLATGAASRQWLVS